jgi:NADH-quinone oxidoreductase subunit L
MTVPLTILAVLSAIGGWIGWPGSLGGENRFEHWLEPVVRGVVPETGAVGIVHHALAKEILLMVASVGIAVLGIWLAYIVYIKNPQLHVKLAASWPHLHNLLVHKYYVDEIYDALFVNRIKDLSTAFGLFDAKVIDGLGVNGAGWLARFVSSVSMWWDKWVVDGLVNLIGIVTRGLSAPIRMMQTGIFTSYAFFILLGLAILLGYYGFHMEHLVRSLR